MLGKKTDVQIAYLNDRGKIGMTTFLQVQVGDHLDKMAKDLEDIKRELNRLYLAQPMEQPEAVPVATPDTSKTSDDKMVAEDGSESIPQEPLLNVIAEDG
jgi:hypothetical protein